MHRDAGRLNGLHAEPGTLLGPKIPIREYVAVTGNDDAGLTVGYAHREDLEPDALEAMVQRGPRSLTEHQMVRGWQVGARLELRRLFGGGQ